MDIKQRTVGDVVVLSIRGDVTMGDDGASRLADTVRHALDLGHDRLVLDLRQRRLVVFLRERALRIDVLSGAGHGRKRKDLVRAGPALAPGHCPGGISLSVILPYNQ